LQYYYRNPLLISQEQSTLKRYIAMFGAAALIFSNTGCNSGGSAGGGSGAVVVSVNGEDITEKEFMEKTQNVTAFNLAPALEQQGGVPGRAGEFALQTLIGDMILFQTAKEKKLIPTDEQITKYIAFAKKYQQNPQATMVNPDPFRDENGWREDVRRVLTYRALIMSNTKMPEDELKKEYEKFRSQLKEQNTYHLRLVDTRTEAKAKEALAALNSGVAFETVALKHSEDPVSGPRSGDVGTVPEQYLTNLVPGILAVVKKLKPNEYHKGVIKQELTEAGPTGQPSAKKTVHYYLVQLVERTEGKTPTFEESRFVLENARLLQKEPGAFDKARQEIRRNTEKADVKVNMARYKDLPQRIKQAAQAPTVAPGDPPGPAPGAMPGQPPAMPRP